MQEQGSEVCWNEYGSYGYNEDGPQTKTDTPVPYGRLIQLGTGFISYLARILRNLSSDLWINVPPIQIYALA
jgi:hypothetical protein